MFRDLPVVARELKAEPEVLERIYQASRLGLRGDSLALYAGLLPVEFRRLKTMDPMADLAEMKGRADAEGMLAGTLMAAAEGGDAKVALEVLRHKHEWQATQRVQLDVSQQISVTAALEAAQKRVDSVVEDAKIIEPQHRGNGAGALTHQPVTEVSDGYRDSDTSAAKRIAALRS